MQTRLTGSIFPYLTEQSSLSLTMHSLAVQEKKMLILGTVQANVHQTLPTQTNLGNPGKKKKRKKNKTPELFFPLTIKSFTLPEFFLA